MNCPYCNKEMESGFLKSSRPIQWGGNNSLGLLIGDLKLTKVSLEGMLNGYAIKSHYCNHCGKIIIAIADK